MNIIILAKKQIAMFHIDSLIVYSCCKNTSFISKNKVFSSKSHKKHAIQRSKYTDTNKGAKNQSKI